MPNFELIECQLRQHERGSRDQGSLGSIGSEAQHPDPLRTLHSTNQALRTQRYGSGPYG